MIKMIDYFDPIMYGGSNPDIPEFDEATVLPSLDPDSNIPAAQGAPVEVTAQPMYTEPYTEVTGKYYDPITNTDFPTIDAYKAAIPSFSSGTRDPKGNTYTQRIKKGGRDAATNPQPVMATGLQAKGTGMEPAPSVKLTQGPGTSAQGPGLIPAKMGYEFLEKHGSTDQQNLAAERLDDLKNFAPEGMGR